MEPSTANATSGFCAILCFPGRRSFMYETLCLSRTIRHPIQHVTRLLVWHNGMWRSWAGHIVVQTSTSPIEHVWNQIGVWFRDVDDTPSTMPVLPSSKRGLQFAQAGWGSWLRACQVVCVLFAPPAGDIPSISGVVTSMYASFNRFIKDTAACHLNFLPVAEPIRDWAQQFYQVGKPDMATLFLNNWILPYFFSQHIFRLNRT